MEQLAPNQVLVGQRPVEYANARFGARRARIVRARAVPCDPRLADAPLQNPELLQGCVAVAARGGCTFVEKARRVQSAGASAVVFVNSEDTLFTLPGDKDDDDISIPIVFLRAAAGADLFNGSLEISLDYQQRFRARR